MPLLGFALVFVLLFRQLGLGATLGYLVAGALVGPHVLGLVGDPERILTVAELGIVLLLFLVGLELNPARLWRMRHDIFGFGLLAGGAVRPRGLARWSGSRPASSGAAALALGLPLALVLDRAGAADAAERRAAAARRSASAPSRSCCSRTCRSCR